MCSLENDASILEYVKQTIKYTNTYNYACLYLKDAVCHLNYFLVRKTAFSMWYWAFLVALKSHVPR